MVLYRMQLLNGGLTKPLFQLGSGRAITAR